MINADDDGQWCFITYDENEKDLAMGHARSLGVRLPETKVYLMWNRESDGQMGYLNPCGNHEIHGEAY